jgi:hypothetical protein
VLWRFLGPWPFGSAVQIFLSDDPANVNRVFTVFSLKSPHWLVEHLWLTKLRFTRGAAVPFSWVFLRPSLSNIISRIALLIWAQILRFQKCIVRIQSTDSLDNNKSLRNFWRTLLLAVHDQANRTGGKIKVVRDIRVVGVTLIVVSIWIVNGFDRLPEVHERE